MERPPSVKEIKEKVIDLYSRETRDSQRSWGHEKKVE
jgi:hypothetical protein